MESNGTILIAGGNEDVVTDRFLSGINLVGGMSENPRVVRAGNFFKILKLASGVDAILALSPLGKGYAGYIAAKLYKKGFIIKMDDDYAWRTAIQRRDTYLLAKDFQNFKRKGKAASIHKRQVGLCAKAQLVIVPSGFMAEMVGGWGVTKDKIKIIPNLIDFGPVETTKEEARKKIGIPGNVIVSAGPLVAWKGFRMLVKIMPHLISMNQFFRLVIVGEGSDHKVLHAMVKNFGLEKKVYLVGSKNSEELSWFLSAADIFILNSGHEPFPYQTIQAMSSGVPVITTAVGANPEIIKQGENGFMIKYNDEFNLIEAIKTVWQTPELRQRFIEEGRKTVEQFSVEKTIKEITKTLTASILES